MNRFKQHLDYNSYNIFFEYKLRPYELEIAEIFEEKIAIEKIKPYLIKYINWRLYKAIIK